MQGPYDIIGLRLHLVMLASGLWAGDTPSRTGITPGEEALEVTRIIDAIYESSEKGREVRL